MISVDAQEIIECPICCEIIIDAVETTCGHAFCEYCLNRCLEVEEACPVCRKDPSPVHPSFILRRLIDEYRQTYGFRREQIQNKTALEEKQIGNTFYQKSKFADAIKHYSRAISVTPSAVLYANRATCHFKLKQYRLSVEDADRAIQLDSNYAKVYVRKALSLEQLKLHRESRDCFMRAREIEGGREFTAEIEQGMARLSIFLPQQPPQPPPQQRPANHPPHMPRHVPPQPRADQGPARHQRQPQDRQERNNRDNRNNRRQEDSWNPFADIADLFTGNNNGRNGGGLFG
eukprot:TRINITY_DN9582_c0_g1_i1.p1 TRINITY_DN9582_c0_g1~~TRINITY_DN9582_c0_g1_i1.p1  ORF type:complete len:289 (+),score=25.06 TRINITY_DN9582_c0_g1_i1:98-964(+)